MDEDSEEIFPVPGPVAVVNELSVTSLLVLVVLLKIIYKPTTQ